MNQRQEVLDNKTLMSNENNFDIDIDQIEIKKKII